MEIKMVKFNNVFVSMNDVEVIVKLKKYKKSYYDVELVWDCKFSPRYFGSVEKIGSKWEITTNQDNYWTDYCSLTFKTLSDAIEYIGITEIESKLYFNAY